MTKLSVLIIKNRQVKPSSERRELFSPNVNYSESVLSKPTKIRLLLRDYPRFLDRGYLSGIWQYEGGFDARKFGLDPRTSDIP